MSMAQAVSQGSRRRGVSGMLDQESVDIGKEPRLVQGTLFDKAELDRLAAEQRRWEETTLKQSLERMPEREHLMTTSSVPVKRLYTPLDVAHLDYMRDIGLPG